MIESDSQDSPDRRPAARIPARDSRGRWVRAAAIPQEFKEIELEKELAAVKEPEFVFDDRVIEQSPPTGTSRLSLRPDDAETAPGNGADTEAGSRPLILDPPGAVFDRLPPVGAFLQEAEPVPRRRLSLLYLSLGAALLLGVAYFVFQHGFSATRQAVVTTPPPAAPTVAPAVPPPAPKKKVRPPDTSPVVTASRKSDKKEGQAIAPVVAPRAPVQPLRPRATPAVVAPAGPAPSPTPPTPPTPAAAATPVSRPSPAPPAPAAAAAPVSRPSPAHPEPSPPVAPESIPDDAPSLTMSDEEGWFSLAEEYLQMGDENSAEALYRRILQGGIQRGRAALALGDLFAKRNDFARAQEFYRVSKQLFQGGVQPASTP